MLSRSAAGDVGIFLGGIALKLLAEIDDPRALRALDRAGLQTVAHELRAYLIEVGAAVGGHFAGSLGAVELTVALHATFDTPDDRIVWDVGHQTYGHKVLTGRRDELPRIKQARGPAGFLRRVESPHDVFGAGHAGTSVSAALGIAEAARRSGSARRAVAVIGDGAATTGMSFEALNHAGQLRNGLRIVFNDNGMSIAPNVGGLNRSGDIAGYVRALGIAYAGPIDGHDLDALLDALASLRDATGPALLHVKTRKGYAYEKAPDQDQFMSRERTVEFFRRVLSRPNAKRWQFNQSPLFIEFLAGAQDYDCIPWSMPAYSVFGWQKPCYLLQDG